jgi:hypothetical protein
MCCGSTGTQTVTEESKSRPWYPQGQYLLGGFAQAANLAQAPGQQAYIGMSPTARQGYEGIVANAQNPNSATNTALKTITDTAGGNFLATGNPYYQQAYARAVAPMIGNFNQQVAPGIDAAFSGAGRYGSGLYAQSRNAAETTLARGLADVSAQMGYQNYDAERARQMQAATIAPQYQDLNNQALISAGNAFQTDQQAAQAFDWSTLGRYMDVVGGNSWGGSTTGTTTQPTYSNPLGDVLGLAGTIASILP